MPPMHVTTSQSKSNAARTASKTLRATDVNSTAARKVHESFPSVDREPSPTPTSSDTCLPTGGLQARPTTAASDTSLPTVGPTEKGHARPTQEARADPRNPNADNVRPHIRNEDLVFGMRQALEFDISINVFMEEPPATALDNVSDKNKLVRVAIPLDS